MAERRLNERQRQFCEIYHAQGNKKNGQKAAIAAGYSPNSAAETASELLNYSNVRTYLESLEENARLAADVTREDIVNELKMLAFYRPDRCVKVGKNGKMTQDFSNATPNDLRAISSISEGNTNKVAFHNKKDSLMDLARMCGYHIDKSEIKHEGFTGLSITPPQSDQATPPADEGDMPEWMK